jgi:hypothetical protein
MKSKAPRRHLCFMVCGLLLALALTCHLCEAQQNKSQNKPHDPNVLDKPSVQRKGTKVSSATPAVRTPMTLSWVILSEPKPQPGSVTPARVEADPSTSFSAGDRLQLEVIGNQDGYLYAFSQTMGRNALDIYTDVRTDKRLLKEEVYSLPSDCTDQTTQCWFEMPARGGNVFFTIIFSRKKIDNLVKKINQVTNFDFDIQTASDIVKQMNNSRNLRVTQVEGRNAFNVSSTNAGADELVVTVLFRKKRKFRLSF